MSPIAPNCTIATPSVYHPHVSMATSSNLRMDGNTFALRMFHSQHHRYRRTGHHANLGYHHGDQLGRGNVIHQIEQTKAGDVTPVREVRLLLPDVYEVVGVTCNMWRQTWIKRMDHYANIIDMLLCLI